MAIALPRRHKTLQLFKLLTVVIPILGFSAQGLTAISCGEILSKLPEHADFIIPSEWKNPLSLAQEIELSGLTQEQIATMRKSSAGIMDIKEFLQRAETILPYYRLGLDTHHLAWPTLKKILPSINPYPYLSLKVKSGAGFPNTTTFMWNVVGTAHFDKPIVFFVPREVFSHPGSFATADELKFLLKYWQEAKEVYYVFGAYNVLTDEGYSELSNQLHSSELETVSLKGSTRN